MCSPRPGGDSGLVFWRRLDLLLGGSSLRQLLLGHWGTSSVAHVRFKAFAAAACCISGQQQARRQAVFCTSSILWVPLSFASFFPLSCCSHTIVSGNKNASPCCRRETRELQFGAASLKNLDECDCEASVTIWWQQCSGVQSGCSRRRGVWPGVALTAAAGVSAPR